MPGPKPGALPLGDAPMYLIVIVPLRETSYLYTSLHKVECQEVSFYLFCMLAFSITCAIPGSSLLPVYHFLNAYITFGNK